MAAQTYYLKTGVIKIGDHFSFVDGEALFEVMEKAAKKRRMTLGKRSLPGKFTFPFAIFPARLSKSGMVKDGRSNGVREIHCTDRNSFPQRKSLL